MDATQDAQLLRTVCEGSPAEQNRAMGALFPRFNAELLRHFRRKNQRPDVAAELAQEVLIKVWQKACSFKGAAAVSSWIFGIARNHLVSLIREEQRQPRLVPLPESSDDWGTVGPLDFFDGLVFDPEVDEHEQMRLIDEAMKQLERDAPERAETLRLSCIYEWTGAQLAEYLGRSQSATYEYVAQCKIKLRAAYCRARVDDGARGARA